MFFPWRKVSIVLRITHVPDQALIMNEAWPAHVCFHHHNTMIKNWGKQDDWHLNWIIVIFHTEERVWACTCAFLRLKQTTGNLALFVKNKKKYLWCVLPKRNGRDTRNSLIWGLGSVQYQQRMCVGRRYWSTYGSVTHGLMVQYLQQTTPRYMKRLTKHVEDKSCGSQNMWKTKHQNNGSFIRNVLLRCRSWSSCCKLPSLTPQRFEGTRKWVGWDEDRIIAIANGLKPDFDTEEGKQIKLHSSWPRDGWLESSTLEGCSSLDESAQEGENGDPWAQWWDQGDEALHIRTQPEAALRRWELAADCCAWVLGV